MYFRFGIALVCILAISLISVALEKENLRLKQKIVREQFRSDVLQEKVSTARAETQKLGAPQRLLDDVENNPIADRATGSQLR